jgi:CRISPR-associated protein Cmr5
MSLTLDQQRAALAWTYATDGYAKHGEEYKRIAKGAPAQIMNSGLLPTLAFYASKRGGAPGALLDHLLRGMSERLYGKPLECGKVQTYFPEILHRLHTRDSQHYRRATDEALELLKWIRQFVDAAAQTTNSGKT